MIKSIFRLLREAVRNNKNNSTTLFLTALMLDGMSIGGSFWLNRVYGDLYDAIPNYRADIIYTQIGKFGLIAMVLVVINGYFGFFTNKLGFAIRTGLTTKFFNLPKRPDIVLIEQRVQEDFRKFGEQVTELTFVVIKSIVNLVLFIGVIINLTEWYIGLAVIIVVFGGTILTRYMGRPIVEQQSKQEVLEAEFRAGFHIRIYHQIQAQFIVINALYKRLAFTQSGLGQAFMLMPFLLLMPLYISKALTMGAFMQSANALSKVIDSLSVLIDNRQVLVNIETSVSRIKFME